LPWRIFMLLISLSLFFWLNLWLLFLMFLLGIVAIPWWGRCDSIFAGRGSPRVFLRIGVVFLGLDFRRWLFFVVFLLFFPFLFFCFLFWGFWPSPPSCIFPLFFNNIWAWRYSMGVHRGVNVVGMSLLLLDACPFS